VTIVRALTLSSILVVSLVFSAHVSFAQSGKTKNSATKPIAKDDDNKESKKTSNSSNRSGEKAEAPPLKSANIFIQPLDIVASKFQDLTFSFDVRVARFVTVGFDYRTIAGSTEDALLYLPKGNSLRGMRLRADAYLNGRAFTTSFVAQFNYSFYRLQETVYQGIEETTSVSGPGVMFGWRWFWSEPGESGLNVGLLLGVYNVDGENYRGLNTTMPDLRLEVGYAF
jgi:hypothetical protein